MYIYIYIYICMYVCMYMYGLSIYMDMAMGADLVPLRISPAELATARKALRDQVPQLV